MSENFERKFQPNLNPEAKDGNAAEPDSLEKALSPEVIKHVMEKVQDINAPETMFNVIGPMMTSQKLYIDLDNLQKVNLQSLEGVLQKGLIGIPDYIGYVPLSKERSSSLIESTMLRNRKKTNVQRKKYGKLGPWLNEIDDKSFEKSGYALNAVNSIALIINKKYIEKQISQKFGKRDGIRNQGRIPPRFIDGVVVLNPTSVTELTEEQKALIRDRDLISDQLVDLNWESATLRQKSEETYSMHEEELRNRREELFEKRKVMDEKIYRLLPYDLWRKLYNNNNREFDSSRLQLMAKEIEKVQRNLYQSKPEYLKPIYDQKGNLLWPKQMSHEEVQKFVFERDAEKSGSDEGG
ncbi:MAG: hypothetical protein WD000_08235 [Thermodesulfobacteriota bacterium]